MAEQLHVIEMNLDLGGRELMARKNSCEKKPGDQALSVEAGVYSTFRGTYRACRVDFHPFCLIMHHTRQPALKLAKIWPSKSLGYFRPSDWSIV